jgi:hypothetical protein
MDQSPSLSRGGDDTLPWYVRAVIVIVVLIILFVLGIDVLELLGAV